MCVFCAAIPLTAAAGASIHRKQQKKVSLAGLEARSRRHVVENTAVAITLLLVCSVYYHTHYGI